jgi:hypothetical protein
MKRYGFALLIVAVLAVVILALVRVRPYLTTPTRMSAGPEVETLRMVVANPAKTVYDMDTLRSDADDVRRALAKGAREALLALPPSQALGAADAAAVAACFADFVMLYRAGEPGDFVEWLTARGRTPADSLTGEPERAASYWRARVGWARTAPLGADQISARSFYRNGTLLPQAEPVPVTASLGRDLRTGEHFSRSRPDRNYTAYEILLPVRVPQYDGAVIHDAQVGIAIVNDGPNASWDTVMTTFYGVDRSTLLVLPPP